MLVFPILRAVATHTLSTAVLDISTSNITIPTNSSFQLTLEGQVRKVGIFPARIYFERPVEVYWIAPEDLSREIRLGSFPLEYIGVAAGHGRIKQLTNFQIEDEAGFSRFTQCGCRCQPRTQSLCSVLIKTISCPCSPHYSRSLHLATQILFGPSQSFRVHCRQQAGFCEGKGLRRLR